MKIIVIGKSGQLANEMMESAPAEYDVSAYGRDQVDIRNITEIEKLFVDEKIDWVINTAAYTAVDDAEAEYDSALALNAAGPEALATVAAKYNCKFIHISTDFVFDGRSGIPYTVNSCTNPINVYGQTKLAGEKAVLAALPSAIVIRTSWVYSRFGNNFVKTMLRLMSERPSLGVVADQVGTPTSAYDLSNFIWEVIALTQQPQGLMHWTNAGTASWYDFAVAIEELGRDAGLLDTCTELRPIPSSAYPTPAKRPSYSVLDKSESWEITPISRHWRTALRDVINQIKN